MIKFKLVTPEKIVHQEEVSQVTLPTENGEITILPNHEPLIALLGKGDIVATVGNEQVPFVAVGGVVKIENNEAIVLADFAESVEMISTQEVIDAAIKRSEDLAREYENNTEVDFEHFQTELARSLTRAQVEEKWRVRKYRKTI